MFKAPKRLDLTEMIQFFADGRPNTAFQTCLMIQDVLSHGVYSASRINRRLDFLFHEFQARHPGLTDALEALSALNDYLYVEQGFSVRTDDKCLTEDYFFGKIFESRISAPLPFSIIYKELAYKLDLAPVNFMNFPSLSLVKVLYNHQLLFIDPCDEGHVLSVADLQTKLHSRYGQSVVLSSSFLETPSDHQVAHRMLTKLKNLYFDLRNWDSLLSVLDLLVCLNPTKLHELKERGLLLYQMGYHTEAKSDLSRFVSQARPSQETEKLKQLVTYLENPKVTPLYD